MKPTIQLGIWLLLVTGSASLLSCKKDSPAKTRTELLTTGTWKRAALTSNPAYDWYNNGTSATDILSYMWPCEKDDFEIYRTNGEIEINEGPTKCDPGADQTWSLTWAFIKNETVILFEGTYEYIIDELTETTLKFHGSFEENGVTYTHYETWTH